MSSNHLPLPPQPTYHSDQSFQPANSLDGGPTPSIHPLQHFAVPQQHQQQQLQQHHHIQDQPTFGARDQDDEASQVAHLTSVSRIVELATHGIQAFVSLYAVSSIISTINFQAAHNFTSLTALFLFFVSGVSFIVASTYVLLAWWSRTSGGLDRIKACLQAGDMKQRAPAPWTIRTAVLVLSIRYRMGIILTMAAATLLAASMQQFKIRNSSNCDALPNLFRHFCQTTKAAVTSTFMSCFFWGVWFAYWFYMVYYKNRPRIVLECQHSRPQDEVMILVPEDEGHAQDTRDKNIHAIEMSEARVGNASPVAPVPPSQSYQSLSNLHHHDQDKQPASNRGSQRISEKEIREAFRHITIGTEGIQDPDPNSLGLGIDIHKQFNLDSTEAPTEHEYIRRAGSISGSSIGRESIASSEMTSIAPSEMTSIDGPERSRSERLRDHAKIFSKVRSNTGSIYEPCSNRNTPLLYSRELAQVSPAISPNMSTPTTPLSRGGIGYMGNQTIKALHNIPRSASMGYTAAFNSMTANSVAASDQVSPAMGASSFEFSGTPVSTRSQRSMSFVGSSDLPSHADAAAAEQRMDERLKAVRRRSFAAEASSGSMILNMADLLSRSGPSDPHNNVDSPPRSNFRMSFSSPNLSHFRRKSTLGLKSVLNSLVNTPVTDSVSDVSSESSSPISILSHGGRDTDSISLSQRSSISGGGGGDGVSVSAQDLLQLEYGELFATLQRSHSALTLTDLSSPVLMHPYSKPGSGVPFVSCRRSRSVSSADTSHSTSTTKTSSSESSTSTASTLTGSLSGEDKPRSGSGKLPGPPLSFMNRILVANQNSLLHTRGNKQQQHDHFVPGQTYRHHPPRHAPLRRVGSSGNVSDVAYHDNAFKHHKKQNRGSRSGSSTPISRKFPSHGDLTQYSWDYRKEVRN